MPHGDSPAGIFVTIFIVVVSMTETSLEEPLAV
jgi:hypothetical protein